MDLIKKKKEKNVYKKSDAFITLKNSQAPFRDSSTGTTQA